jgi:RES domain-containing protein
VRFWRIYNSRYGDPLSGEGARRYGGRWNPKGVSVIYLADSPALAMLEILVRAPGLQQARQFRAAEIDIDARLIPAIPTARLPPGWDGEPASPISQDFGNRQFTGRHRLGFRVPSVVVPIQQNAVILTSHKRFPQAAKIIRSNLPCPFDRRLLGD